MGGKDKLRSPDRLDLPVLLKKENVPVLFPIDQNWNLNHIIKNRKTSCNYFDDWLIVDSAFLKQTFTCSSFLNCEDLMDFSLSFVLVKVIS